MLILNFIKLIDQLLTSQMTASSGCQRGRDHFLHHFQREQQQQHPPQVREAPPQQQEATASPGTERQCVSSNQVALWTLLRLYAVHGDSGGLGCADLDLGCSTVLPGQ